MAAAHMARTILGPLPASRAAEANWIAAAGAIAAYRERWDIATDTCPRPTGGMQELDWVTLARRLSQLRDARSNHPATPASSYQYQHGLNPITASTRCL